MNDKLQEDILKYIAKCERKGNVSAMYTINHKDYDKIPDIINWLEKIGYTAKYQLLNAVEYYIYKYKYIPSDFYGDYQYFPVKVYVEPKKYISIKLKPKPKSYGNQSIISNIIGLTLFFIFILLLIMAVK